MRKHLKIMALMSPHNSKSFKVAEPPVREAGVKVETIQELVDKLKNEAGVLS